MSAGTLTADCPVCLRKTGDEDRCGGCAWTLSTPFVLGEVTEARRREFDAALDRACGRYDRRAALLAAGFPRLDRSWLDQLLALCRGVAVDLDELAPDLTGQEEPRVEDAMSGTISAAMVRLVTGPLERVELAVVELVPDGVGLVLFERAGLSLAARGGVRFTPWRTLLPALPAEAARRRLVLAGGIGTEPADLAALDGQLATLGKNPVFRSTAADVARELVLLNRTPGWSVPRAVSSGLRARFARLTVTEVALADQNRALTEDGLADLAVLAPLRSDVAVVVAEVVGRDGTIRLTTRPVFAAGDSVATTEAVLVDVAAPAVARTPVSVVTVTRGTSGDPASWRPVSVERLQLRPDERHVLRFALAGPGQLTVHCGTAGRGEAVPAGRLDRAWTDLLKSLPPVYKPAPVRGADIVLAVELAGEEPNVAHRLRLAAQVVGEIDQAHPNPSAVRFGVLAFTDHSGTGRVLHRHGPGPAAKCLDYLENLRPAALETKYAAPLEDALNTAGRFNWRDKPVSRTLLVLGSRPPHHASHPRVSRCPNGLSWEAALQKLRVAQIRVLVVWDMPDWARRGSPDTYATTARRIWGDIAGRALLDSAGHDAASVVQRLAVLDPVSTDRPLLLPISATRDNH